MVVSPLQCSLKAALESETGGGGGGGGSFRSETFDSHSNLNTYNMNYNSNGNGNGNGNTSNRQATLSATEEVAVEEAAATTASLTAKACRLFWGLLGMDRYHYHQQQLRPDHRRSSAILETAASTDGLTATGDRIKIFRRESNTFVEKSRGNIASYTTAAAGNAVTSSGDDDWDFEALQEKQEIMLQFQGAGYL